MNWQFVYDGMLSIRWIMHCNDLGELHENPRERTIGQTYDELYGDLDGEHKLLNSAVLFMAAYLYFLFIKEHFKTFSLDNIDTTEFTIVQSDKPHDKARLMRRLRNSIAHANYSITGDVITFRDNDHRKKDFVKITIGTVQFGKFLEDFRGELFTQFHEDN